MPILLLLILVLTTGCASPTPPLAPDQARVELSTLRPADEVRAHRLNGELVRGLRFGDLPPGAHRLEVRLRYEPMGRAGPSRLAGRNLRSCILALEYADFEAGGEYRIIANQLGWQSVAWLENVAGDKLASARTVTCSPAI